MGVIRKKTGGRGSEGGVKYICDVCSVDITSTVSINPLPLPLGVSVAKITSSSWRLGERRHLGRH